MKYLALAMMLTGSTCGLSPVYAHDGVHDEFLKTLTNQSGGSCCDGSDAYSVVDPDWEFTSNPKAPYRVKLGGEWFDVSADAVVKQPNEIGVAKAWPVDDEGATSIRCFMPGAGV